MESVLDNELKFLNVKYKENSICFILTRLCLHQCVGSGCRGGDGGPWTSRRW